MLTTFPEPPFRLDAQTHEEAIKIFKYLELRDVRWVSDVSVCSTRILWYGPTAYFVNPDGLMFFRPLDNLIDEEFHSRLIDLINSTPNLTSQFFEPTLSVEEIFVQFLKHHRKFTSFKRSLADPDNVRQPSRFITGAFRWSQSPEGGQFWHLLDNKWLALLNKFNLNSTNKTTYRKILSIR